MPLQEDYKVSLDAFHGPLDLLLFLIRRAEVDIHDIPIAQITRQYLRFLRRIDEIDIDLASEFLVMAATLMEIKSRSLVPPESPETGGELAAGDGQGSQADPRAELVQQLLAFQRYRVASAELDQRRLAFVDRFPLTPARAAEATPAVESAEPVELDLEDVHVMDLADAYEHIVAAIDFDRLGDHHVELDDTPAELHQADLLDRLQRAPGQELTLQEAFEGRPRGQAIGLFLAMLELVRMRQITIRQDDIAGPIRIILTADEHAGPVIEMVRRAGDPSPDAPAADDERDLDHSSGSTHA